MSKITEWRRGCPKMVRENQILAMEIDTLFLVRQNGPLAFVVQDIDKPKPFEVRLGDPHKCTCKWYIITTDLCVHICWIMLKKFRISWSDAMSFQKGMSTQELRTCMSGREKQCKKQRQPRAVVNDNSNSSHMLSKPVPKRPRKTQDTCPICLDGYSLNDNSVMHCKYSCGNIVHTRCMWMLLRHQETQDEKIKANADMLKCPLCRGSFNTVAALKIELRREVIKRKMKTTSISAIPTHDIYCCFCKTKPVRGNLYRCLDCHSILLCAVCLSSEDFRIYHGTHNYGIKQKSDGPWRRLGKVEEHLNAFNRNGNVLWVPRPPFSKTKNLLEFSKGFSFNCANRADFCGICATVFENISNLAATCGHYFHQDCLEEHMKTSEKCPLDKKRIRPLPFKRKYYRPAELKIPPRNGILMGPLEVRVSRMHLEQRNKESNNKSTSSVTASSARLEISKNRDKTDVRKASRPTTSLRMSDLDGRSLSTRVNPLMSILMSPHLKQFVVDREKKGSEENEATFKKQSLGKIKVNSLELPDEYTRKTKFQSKSTPSPLCGKRTFKRSRSSTAALH